MFNKYFVTIAFCVAFVLAAVQETDGQTTREPGSSTTGSSTTPSGPNSSTTRRTTRGPASTTIGPGPSTTRRPGSSTTGRPGSSTTGGPGPQLCPPRCAPVGPVVCGRNARGLCVRFAHACQMEHVNCRLPPNARWTKVPTSRCARTGPIGQPRRCAA